jgi:catechol 2,3-dioxygenase-like lactoylglutathione lyase family enzyme
VTFRGVDHIGVGVGDMDVALDFYGRVGFSDVLFDYRGPVPGTEAFTTGGPRQARVAMVSNPSATPVGPGRLKLVQVLDGDGPAPIPQGTAWGELGICEICLHVRDLEAVHARLAALPGGGTLMAPLSGAVVPYDVSLDISYVHDPWGGKIEMIEWTGLWKSLPGAPRAEGVNHVAFGVTDMDASLAFYRRLGFGEMLFESTDFFDPMAPWYDRELPEQHMVMMMSTQGGGIEPTRLTPLGPDCRGEWGHLGPMEFGVGVSNLELACEQLAADGEGFLGEIQTVDVGGAHASGEWRYRYLDEPDGLYVSLVEGRF